MAITYQAGRRIQGISTGGVTQSGTIDNVSYANKSVAVNGGREPWVGNSGTKMYTIQDNPDNIYEYTLGTAWDVTTATYIGTSALSGTTSPGGLIFKPDGTKFFVGDFSTNKVHQYNLSTAWDVSTISTGTAVSANDPYGLAFSSDGTQFYTCTAGSGGVANQYSLSTAWDLSSTVTSVSSISVISGARAITFYDDGTRFFVLDGYNASPYLAEYTCTAWTLSTAVATGNTFTFSETTSAVGAFVADNNTRLYLNNEGGTKKIWQYDIAQVATSDYTRLTNAQVGSRFEETDTRKMYHYVDNSTTGLKAYYKFDESSGDIINQHTTGDGLASADLTATSVTYSSTGIIGNAIQCNGTSSKMVSPSATKTDFNFIHALDQAWSVNIWFKKGTAETGSIDPLFANRIGSDVGIRVNCLDRSSESEVNKLQVEIDSGSAGSAVAMYDSNVNNFFPVDTDWHMLTITADNSITTDAMQIYLDGTLNHNVNRVGVGDGGTPEYPMNICYKGDTSASEAFGAYTVDETSFWTRKLSSTDVTTLYNSGSGLAITDGIFTSWSEEGT